MHHRRSTATALAALLPLAAVLTSCGFDYPTDRVNTIAAGVNDRDGEVDVLGARVVAFSEGKGRLIGTLVYNDNDADGPVTLVEVVGAGITVTAEDAEIEVPPNRHVNLAADDAPALAVDGDFTAGDFVELTYSFDNSETVTVEVPVVKPCHQYAGIAEPDTAAAADESDADESGADAGEGEEAEAGDATFLCEQEPPAHGEEEGH